MAERSDHNAVSSMSTSLSTLTCLLVCAEPTNTKYTITLITADKKAEHTSPIDYLSMELQNADTHSTHNVREHKHALDIGSH